MSLNNLKKRIVALGEFDVNVAIADIINNNEHFVSELLRTQLRKGIDADNEKIYIFDKREKLYRPYYSEYTTIQKEAKGQETGFVNFKDTEAFYLNIYTVASAQTHDFTILSDVPYFWEIIGKNLSGYKIMELTKENLLRLKEEIIMPQLKIYMENAVK